MPRQCLMGVGGSASFNPTSVSGLKLWLKADAGTYQSSGGSAATADADPVGEWQDQSGQGNHVTQATSSKRPTLKLSILNSLPVVRFDGVDDYLSKTFSMSQPVTMFSVVSYNNNTDLLFVFDGQSLNAFELRSQGGGTGGQLMYVGGGPGLASTWGITGGTFYTISGLYNGASSWIRKNNASEETGDVGSGGFTTFNVGIAGNQTGFPLAGDIAELLLYDSNIGSTSRDAVANYLKGKWGHY